MAYEIYKQDLNQEEYFATWSAENLATLDEELKKQIYAKHIVKRKVFRRDSFKCQNVECRSSGKSPLTFHHIKFRKNNGQDKVRNGVTLCRACHMGYHKAKYSITFPNTNYLPPHIRGQTFILHKEEKVDWKLIKSEMKKFRKTLTKEKGIVLSGTIINLLLKWLHTPYEEWDD